MAVETASERFLFAVCAVDMDLCTAEEVAQAAMAPRGAAPGSASAGRERRAHPGAARPR